MAQIYNSQLDAFDIYHRIQESQRPAHSFSSPKGIALPALGHALAGSTGAAISNLCTYPLDLIITRLQIQRQLRRDESTTPSPGEYEGIRDAARKIYETEGGVAAFYAGVLQDTGKTIADSFLFFLAYNFLRRRRIAARGISSVGSLPAVLPAIDELAVGFLAGSFTKLLTTPIANIVTRKQAAALILAKSSQPPPLTDPSSSKTPSLSSRSSPSAAQIARDILDQKGVSGFWSGYSASLVLTLNPSLTFFLYETFKRLLPRSRQDHPTPAATFLMAAVSKACASTVTYPFSVAKTRAQAGGQDNEASETTDSGAEFKGGESGTEKRRVAPRTTLLSTLVRIVEREGVQGLYEGLLLEIVKAFFNHGITMLVKQAVHRLIIRTWYLLSIIVSKNKRKSHKSRTREPSYEYYDLARARVDERGVAAEGLPHDAWSRGGKIIEDMKEGIASARDGANETAELVADYVEEETEEWRNLYGPGLARWFEEK